MQLRYVLRITTGKKQFISTFLVEYFHCHSLRKLIRIRKFRIKKHLKMKSDELLYPKNQENIKLIKIIRTLLINLKFPSM